MQSKKKEIKNEVIICSSCGGSGMCKSCKGKHEPGLICSNCGGSGKCPSCNGRGKH